VSTIREQLVVAAVLALNTSTPGGVPAAERTRRAGMPEGAVEKYIGVGPSRDLPEEVGGGGGPLMRSSLTLAVEMWAPGSDADRPDKVVDPLYEWVVKTLGGNALGGLALDIVEGESTFEYGGGEYPYVKLTTEMIVSYQHVVNDPTRRV
jgi:hypothetical protein